jgi:hypothetical protein
MRKTAQRLAQRSHGGAQVVQFRPRLEAARLKGAPSDGCGKCGSGFVVREPAFVHCRYCGHMARIPTGSLLEQELFELRSGLRLAS